MATPKQAETSSAQQTRGWKSPGRSQVRPKGNRRSDTLLTVALFLPPALLLFTIFVVLPMGEAMYFSFYKWNGFGSPENFVGLKHYFKLIKHSVFHKALWHNAYVIVASILIQIPLAFAMAVILADKIPGGTFFRLLFFLPYVLAEIAAGLIWRFVYDGDTGLLSNFLGLFGHEPFHILAQQELAMTAIIVVIIWKYFGFHMMLFIAGLQAIDRDLYKAAHVDGATSWQVLRYVTLPLLKSTTALSIFFGVLGSLQLFDLIMPMTLGGPNDSSQTMVTYLYNFGIVRMKVGFGGAVGTVLFIICVVFAFTYKRTFMRDE